jgi:heme A synthase
MDTMKKVVSYILITCVLLFTVVAILGIWDIIDLKNVMMNTIFSLIVIFAASAVILFIYTVFMRDNDQNQP